MKTITEFSGILLRQAAEAQQAFRAAHPQANEHPTEPAAEAVPAAETPGQTAVEAAAAAETPEQAAAETPAETDPAAQDVASAETGTGSEPANNSAPEPAVETAAPDLGTGPEAEAVAATMHIEGDRLSRLMEALAVAGKRASGVRLVRVLSGDKPPANAQKKGDFYYVLDMMPRPESRRDADSRGDDRRGRGGGRDRDSRGGGRGPGGGPGGGRGPGGGPGGGGRGGRAGGFDALGRDADLPRGEMAKGGEGWMLTRAPEERRGGNRGPVDPTRREQPSRPPRGPRFDGRGPGPSGDRPAGDHSPGGRPPRGARPPFGDRPPRPDRPLFGDRPPRPDRPDQSRGSAGGEGLRGPGPGREVARAQSPRPSGEQRPYRSGGDDNRRGQGWSAPMRRRGGWDDPPVVEAISAAGTVPQPEPAPAVPEIASAPALEAAEGEKK